MTHINHRISANPPIQSSDSVRSCLALTLWTPPLTHRCSCRQSCRRFRRHSSEQLTPVTAAAITASVTAPKTNSRPCRYRLCTVFSLLPPLQLRCYRFCHRTCRHCNHPGRHRLCYSCLVFIHFTPWTNAHGHCGCYPPLTLLSVMWRKLLYDILRDFYSAGNCCRKPSGVQHSVYFANQLQWSRSLAMPIVTLATFPSQKTASQTVLSTSFNFKDTFLCIVYVSAFSFLWLGYVDHKK